MWYIPTCDDSIKNIYNIVIINFNENFKKCYFIKGHILFLKWVLINVM